KGNRTGKAGTLKATDEAAKGEPMTETKQTSTTKTDRRPDCVTEIRMGNSVLTVSGFFKQGATDTAADKMMKVLEAEAATQKTAI
ncbi:transposon-encoded TnpW family protein, partial [Ruminococcoides intestinale]|uniref:transposon-encoded TnpW family protein n=1 Tax=Ruminococcoides intestinale TaxID=3133162 RepID=UPI003F691291